MRTVTPDKRPDRDVKAAVYSYRFAVSAVDAFLQRYSRVCIFVSKKLHIDAMDLRENLINAFMYRNRRWILLRNTLKLIHNQDMYDELAPLTYPDFVKYLTSVKSMAEDEWLDSKNV